MTRDPSPSVQRDADGRLRHLITLEGLSAEGPSFRVLFNDTVPHTLVVTATHPESGESREFTFEVGRIAN